ncbi:MAG TPA: hypothetical protein VH186_06095 [Chloroflexia bacterium]|nr:hypothetical protein [Chloroflexia bacterium]
MNFRSARASRYLKALFCLLLIATFVVPVTAFADPNFTSDNFKLKWERADKAVAEIKSNPARSWLWGPESFLPAGGDTEPYADSPGGKRQVIYFDKARMELNNPATGLVTNGRLVFELISGQLATGDAPFVQRKPASDIPVAGDAVNNDGPTYGTFGKVASLNLDNPAPNLTGQPVTASIDKNGNVGSAVDLGSKAKYAYFEGTLKHNIPDVFWNFLNQKGNVYEGGKYVDNQPVLGVNPAAPWLDATGYPITESYWAKVTVGGVVKDVLIQNFERRTLTFTPSNQPAFQVEMGNVGRHYFTWRYDSKYDIPVTPPQPVVNSCNELPVNSPGVETLLRCGPAGMEIPIFATLDPNETVQVYTVNPDDSDGVKIGSFDADRKGDVEIKIITRTSSSLGFHTYRLVGVSSGKKLDAHVWLDPPRTSPTILASALDAKLTDLLAFAIVGFNPDEEIRYQIKTPDGIEYHSNFTIHTSSGGGYTIFLLPAADIPNAKPGEWTFAAVSVADPSRFAGIKFTLK